MTDQDRKTLRFFGSLLQTAAIVALALGGLCSCGMLVLISEPGGHTPFLRTWGIPLLLVGGGAALWIAGRWIRRKGEETNKPGGQT